MKENIFEIHIETTPNKFKKGEVLNFTHNNKLVIIEPPRYTYKNLFLRVFFKILNILTFKRCFNVKYTYTVKELE